MEALEYAKFLSALFFVLALIVGFAWLARRSGIIPTGLLKRPTGGQRRLAVSEVLTLDSKHRLVLVSRDGTEHLIILGPQSETVIECGIDPAAVSSPDDPPKDEETSGDLS